MKNENNTLEENISQLIKCSAKIETTGNDFIRQLIAEALDELAQQKEVRNICTTPSELSTMNGAPLTITVNEYGNNISLLPLVSFAQIR